MSFDLDDFPMSARGTVGARDFYESYLQSKELFDNIPQKLRAKADDADLHGIVKEITAARVGAPALFRRRVDASEALSRWWLAKARSGARWVTEASELKAFNGLTATDLQHIAKLSGDVRNLSKLRHILASYGVVLVYEPSIEGMKLDGAVFLMDSGIPVVALSLRYPRLDIFWFSLLHELAHIVLHHDQLMAPILDDHDSPSEDIVELQADKLARDSLISRADWRSCSAKYTQSEEELIQFAHKVNVHPSIVAGRLRRDWNRHDIFSKIINEVDVRKALFAND